MLALRPILDSALAWRVLACAMTLPFTGACGQKGDLTIPSGAAAEQRATLPQTLGLPTTSSNSTTVAPAMPFPAASTPSVTGTASPVRQP